MKILALQAENIKRLVAVEIHPTGNVVELTGRNGQGKTSILDAIYYALVGPKVVPGAPIRRGQTEASVRVDLGGIVVTRTFKRAKDGDDYTTQLKVEGADGARFASPQAMLDDLMGQLTFDPLAFTRMKQREQFDTLKQFVPGVDFDKVEQENDRDYNERQDINRRAREARVKAEAIRITPGFLDDPIDEKAIMDRMEGAAAHNAELEARAQRRRNAQDQMKKLRSEADDLRRRAAEAEEMAAALERKLAEAETLPEPYDVAAIRAELEKAQATNAELTRRAERRKLEQYAGELEDESAALTKRMDQREADKRAAIAAAALPVPGIGFGADAVLLNDLPFEQASGAEKLRASVAIAMALNPKLRVIRVCDGSLLDEDSMQILAAMAGDRDYQVWIERVDGSGKVGFVIEDGAVRAAVPA